MPDAVALNARRARLLLVCAAAPAALVLAVVLGAAGAGAAGALGAVAGLVVALLVVGGAVAAVTAGSHRVALAATGARPADGPDHVRLHNLVEGLCVGSGLPKPGVWVIGDDAPNALALARATDDAAVVVTRGLLRTMTRVELEGVLAHELARIRTGDAVVGSLAATCLGGLAALSPPTRAEGEAEAGPVPSLAPARLGLPLLVLAPLTAWLVGRLAPERTESHADVAAVEITRYPPALVTALGKLAAAPDRLVAAPVLAHLWIAPPGAGPHPVAVARLYDTPPPLDQRIETLQEL